MAFTPVVRLLRSRCLYAAVMFLLLSNGILADDYRWTREDPEGEQQLLPVDPEICKVYEQNLRYFARKNTPMSCSRPIAPHLKKRIKEVEWDDLDTDKYAELFRKLLFKEAGYLAEKSDEIVALSLQSARERVSKRISVFRRAKLSLVGRNSSLPGYFDPEPYWIVQFGINRTSPDNPDEVFRCTPQRGGIEIGGPNLYIVVERTLEIAGNLGKVTSPSHMGQHLREIDGRLFIENIYDNGFMELNEVIVGNAFADPVCNFQFKKSTLGRK